MGTGTRATRDLGRLLLWAQRDFTARAHARLRARGYAEVGLAHAALLANVDTEGTSVSALAERVGTTTQAMGRLALELEGAGYGVRTPDPADRRATIVTSTAAGRQFLTEAMEVKWAVEAEYAALIGEREVAALRELLGTLVDRARSTPPRGDDVPAEEAAGSDARP